MSVRPYCLTLCAGLFLSLAGHLWAAEPCERLIATGNPDTPPYLWRDPQHPQRLIGASADLLQQLAAELGVQLEVLDGGAWPAAQEEVRSGRIDLLLGAPLDTTPLERLDYIQPAMWSELSLLWTRRDRALVYSDWNSLRGYTGAGVLGAERAGDFSRFAKDNLLIEELPSLTQAFQTLVLGHRDYVLALSYQGQAEVDNLALTAEVMALPQPVASLERYLGLSQNSVCNTPELRGQLAQKMTELLAAGVPQAVLQRNLERWKTQLPPVVAPNQ